MKKIWAVFLAVLLALTGCSASAAEMRLDEAVRVDTDYLDRLLKTAAK